MRVLIGCDVSGLIRDAFRALGYDALSCDLAPCVRKGPHYEGDIRDVLYDGWDLLIATPPMPDMSRDAAGWIEAQKLAMALLNAPIPRIAVVGWTLNALPGVGNCDQRLPSSGLARERHDVHLWLRGLPALDVDGKRYAGLAEAMAKQWGGLLFDDASLRLFGNG